MADQTAKPEETALPAPVTADVPVEAPVAEGAVAEVAPVVEAPVPAEKPAVAAAPKPARKPTTEKAPAKAPVAAPVVAAPAPAAKVKKAKAVSPKPKPAKAEPVAKATVAKPKAQAVRAVAASPASKTKSKTVSSPKLIPTRTQGAAQSKLEKPALKIKEPIMAKTTPTDFIASFQSAFGEFQTKAATAYEKSTAALTEANDFAKGNVEAVVESGKILASGLQELGTSFVSESRSAFDTITTEVKELASVKTPAEFFSLQGNLARKNFDNAVAQASKNTEALLKLANEVFSPLSSRVSLAVEKVSKAA